MQILFRIGLPLNFFVIFACSSGFGQAKRSRGIPAAVDTSAWSPLATYVIAQLATYIASAASDTISEPWIISLPKDLPKRAALERHLRLMLRARDRTPMDDHFFELKLSSPTLSGDTMDVLFETSLTQLCANPAERHGGYHNVDRVFLVRRRLAAFSVWTAAKSKGVLHGDRFGCVR
jgi:hypothetical protein